MDFAQGQTFASVGDFEHLVLEWDRKNSLGGERKEREKWGRKGRNVREKWGSRDWFGGGEVCYAVDSTWFFSFCGEGMVLEGDEGCLADVRGWVWS